MKTDILSPMFFGEKDIPVNGECSPEIIFRDPRFSELLGEEYAEALPLFKRVLAGDQSLSGEDLKKVAEAFEVALLRWHEKVARLERVVDFERSDGKETPWDTEDLANAITKAAETFFDKLRSLGHKFRENPELDGKEAKVIREMINGILERISSVVVYEGAPVVREHINKELAGVFQLRTVGNTKGPDKNAALYFRGSKRSDLAVCTEGERLLKNLEKHSLDPEKYEVLTLKLSGNPVVMVAPRGAQGCVGLKDLFEETGVILSPDEVKTAPDIIFLGAPDEVFEGISGIVQGSEGKILEVEGSYKRFHYTAENGTTVYAVGGGKDGEGRELDYFGVFKKGSFQLASTRQLQRATELLAKTGRPVTQPYEKANSGFRYKTGEREISDEEAAKEMVAPFHGTFLLWHYTDTPLEELESRIIPNRTVQHTLFEGQSGMGKSEMEQFTRVLLRNLRILHDIMENSDDAQLRELAEGISMLNEFQIYSAGDDMGQIFFDEKTRALKCKTHERGRFTRLDNVPEFEDLQARETKPLGANGAEISTTNNRVIQRDKELEILHKVPISVRNAALATNMPLPVEGIDPRKPVQEVDFETYIQAFALYQNIPNGTKDSVDPTQSPGTMHEFMGQYSVAGGPGCENAVAVRKFMFEREIARRKRTGDNKMRFYIMNTDMDRPSWIDEEEYASLNEAEKQKVAFATVARSWADVDELLPSKVQAAFKFAEENLGINLAELAYRSERMSATAMRLYFEKRLDKVKNRN